MLKSSLFEGCIHECFCHFFRVGGSPGTAVEHGKKGGRLGDTAQRLDIRRRPVSFSFCMREQPENLRSSSDEYARVPVGALMIGARCGCRTGPCGKCAHLICVLDIVEALGRTNVADVSAFMPLP